MENKTDKPYSRDQAKDDAAKEVGDWKDWREFSDHYQLKSGVDYMINYALRLYASKATEELRKERDHIFEQALEQRRKVLLLEAEIEHLKESNKNITEENKALSKAYIEEHNEVDLLTESNKQLLEALLKSGESNKQLEEASDELLTEFIQKLLLRTSIEELKKEFTIKRKES